jgi:endonuclease VIII
VVTAAESTAVGARLEKVVGTTVEAVEARGKHLLVRFDNDLVLHSHMRMTGAWHVYPAGERWQRPRWQARVVLAAGDRVAVCFNAPVVELFAAREEPLHPSLPGLGPDVLAQPLDLAEVRRRARARDPGTALGELLLDQRVVAGIGNIWRCEALFARRLDPWAPVASIDDGALDALVETAARLMRANVVAFGRDRPRVHGRAGRPCPRCGTTIRARGQGDQARVAYWCPGCQNGY